MNIYFETIIGQLIGILFIIAIQSYLKQRSDKYNCSFFEAFKVYCLKDTGSIFLSFLILGAILFVIPELAFWLTNGETDESVKNKWLERFFNYTRIFSLVIGIASYWLPFIIFGRAKCFFSEYETTDVKRED